MQFKIEKSMNEIVIEQTSGFVCMKSCRKFNSYYK
jgi:hypothetical protein